MKFFVMILLSLFVAMPAWDARAQDQNEAVAAQTRTLDRIRATLDDVKARLEDAHSSAATLKDLLADLDPLPGQLQGVLDRLTPKMDAAKARVAELAGKKEKPTRDTSPPTSASPATPAPTAAPAVKGKEAAGAPPATPATPAPNAEDSAAARMQAELAEENKYLEALDATVKRARAMLIETGQVQLAVLDRERAVFKHELFRQTNSLFSYELWREVDADAPSALTTARFLAEHSATTFVARLRSGPQELIAAAAALIAVLALAGSLLTRRMVAHGAARPTEIEKAAGAAIGALAIIATPLVVIGALAVTLTSFDLVDPVARPFMDKVLQVAALTAVSYALARAVFAPAYPHWRLIDPGTEAANALTRLVLFVAIVIALSHMVEQAAISSGARLSIIIANRGVSAVIVALLLVVSLIRIRGGKTPASEAQSERAWFGLARVAAMGVVAAILLACALGYVTLASFVVFVLTWLMMVVVSVRLFQALAAAAIETAFDPNHKIGQALAGALGREPLRPASVLLSGLITLLCALVGVIVALAPFGVESDTIFTNIRTSFYALNIGDVTVSPAATAAALALFGAVLASAHALRRWLETRFLPLTRLDKGLRSSIGAGVSYLGLFAALAAGFGYLGFGLDKLAILAGALSVGVGFGLQSIVNNFVSGLIILWEGAIRVGDWIVIGEEQGHVTRINVRSTEIETFDRATMIIPNSNLVSGSVKNWVRGDRVGRIKIALTQRATVDPAQVEDILLAAARAQDGVLRIPAPQVMFLAMDFLPMDQDAFRFELWCYVEDVEKSARVRSDLHFDLYRRLVEARLLEPAAKAASGVLEEVD
jgi:potassium-dependent mechanosensitive channel